MIDRFEFDDTKSAEPVPQPKILTSQDRSLVNFRNSREGKTINEILDGYDKTSEQRNKKKTPRTSG